jgi:FkbM family methyltransferase
VSIGGFEGSVRRMANRLGVDVHRHRPERSEHARLAAMLAHHAVDLVLDVGANVGQFAGSLRDAGYKGRLVSFEPLSTAHAELLRRSRADSQWEIAPRAAIGDREGEIELHIAGNSASSSVLDMLDSHRDAAPESTYRGVERVRVARLDTLAGGYLQPETVPFLKVDVQGYESQVLDGADKILARLRGLQIELSFVPLYAGQRLFDAMTETLRALGFRIWAVWPGLCDARSGRMLQVDAVLFRD